ncbi:MAG: EAL domain-containing protein [Spirochaetia bacterium]|nr:EAL domain-containing protein [Spirochaetia bacterium]
MIKPVLIVDDDPVSLFLMEAALIKLNYKVITFNDPVKAWENIKLHHYDLIILDLEMPEINGLLLTQKIRNLYNDECIILMMTGHEEMNLLDEALNLGVDDYVVKPVQSKTIGFKLHILENQIKKLYERIHYQKELIKSQEHYMAIFHNSSVGVLLMSKTGDILEYNETLSKITGYLKIGLRDKYIINCVHKNDAEKLRIYFRNLINNHHTYATIEIKLISRSGLELICKFSSNVVESFSNPEDNFIMVLIEDITEIKKYEQEIVFNMLHDPLTNLPNRELFFNRLNKLLMKEVEGQVNLFAILILDIDRFQLINETLGHSKGDHLIQKVSQRLFGLIEPGDTIARLTGDEFGIITEKYCTVGELTHFVGKLQDSLRSPILIDDQEITITASIGIKLYEGGEESTLSVLRDADTALHRAKNKGPSSYSFFIQKMTLESHQTLKLENDLRKAIDNNNLELHFQPQLDLNTNKIMGVEALLRWNHPELGNIPPSKFIPIAENAGIIVEIGNWVIVEALKKCKKWSTNEINNLKISVNFSSLQLKEKNLISLITKKIQDYIGCSNRLQIEMTESILMENPKESIEIIKELKKLGIELAIDDFGTGYSSFTYLKMLPVNTLKIDVSFIENIIDNESDRSIVMAIISMAHSMKIKVIAEGVETKEQMMILKKLKCDSIQGYYISKPVSEADFLKFIAEKTNLDRVYRIKQK